MASSSFTLQSFAGPAAFATLDTQAHEGIEFFAFPGGERHVRLPASVGTCGARIWTLTAGLYSATGVVDLLLLVDAMRRAVGGTPEVHLVMPYVPYARQDRVAVAG